jgi:diguanylate cyclase (GGDEF)-like protein/PAS domain S-box-containing protein
VPRATISFDTLHPVLARQLRRHLRGTGAATLPSELLPLIQTVSETYRDADDERGLMANTIAATSAELIDRHERLARSERGYRELFESNPWPLLVCDPETLRILAVNETAVDRYGYGRDALCAMRLDELGRPEDAATVHICAKFQTQATDGQGAATHTLRTLHHVAGGRSIDVDLTAHVIEYGGRRACLVAAVDVTEQVAADRAVRDGETRLRSIFDHAALGICEMDLEGVILETNPAFQRLLGHTAEELRGRTATSLSPAEEASVTLGPMRELVAGRHGAFTVEQRFTRCDGQPIWGSLTMSKMDLGSGSQRLLALLQDVSERKELEAQLTRQAFQDSLTGLANRALFRDRVAHALTRSARSGKNDVAVLFVDLDSFKTVNDGLGHAAGDRLLVSIGTRLAGAMRAGDTVARLGGDEFAILLEEVLDESEVLTIAERALAAVRAPVQLGASEVFVGASIGAAFGRDASSADDLLRNSDVAMYAAKSAGKGRCAVFEPAMHERAVERQQLEADLRPALERGEFRVLYQPILELSTNRLRGVEALLRWHHPKRGFVAPARFICAAEETGLIVPIGRWVLEQACAQVASWRGRFWDLDENGNTDFSVSVNLSGRQLRDDDVVDDVRGALERSGLPPRMLLLEITESVLVNEFETATGRLELLRALGIRLAIDDFGTGYSSLSYLQRFPVAVLKIDKSFTDGIGRSAHDAAIVRTIVALAGTLNLSAVAEGVEDAEQHEALMQAGCEFGQGFHFARPVDAAEVERIMDAWPIAPALAELPATP